MISALCLAFGGDLVAKKYLGLGEPIVYDAHALWGYSPRENRRYTRFGGDIVTINDVGVRGLQRWRAAPQPHKRTVANIPPRQHHTRSHTHGTHNVIQFFYRNKVHI